MTQPKERKVDIDTFMRGHSYMADQPESIVISLEELRNADSTLQVDGGYIIVGNKYYEVLHYSPVIACLICVEADIE